MNDNEINNRVSGSSLITFNLEELYPVGPLAEVDLKVILFQGLILRESDLRNFIRTNEWQDYHNKHVAVYCSVDAVIPTWAYMLLGIALQPYATTIFFGNREGLISQLYHDALEKVSWKKFKDAKVVIKGCGDVPVPASAYLEAATLLRPLASSIMYGEPCSNVPLYKRTK